MLPKYHVPFGFIFAGIIWILFPIISFNGLLIIFLSSFLIDVDHYTYFVYKKHDFSLKNAYVFATEMDKKF